MATLIEEHTEASATYDEYGTGSVCGPEYYAGGEWSRRYTWKLKNGNYLVVTDYAAVIDGADLRNRDDRDRPYVVEDCTEILECTDPSDPGMTEVHCDYVHGEGSLFAYETVESAEREAKRFADRFSPDMFDLNDE